jgi:hypothetical protein
MLHTMNHKSQGPQESTGNLNFTDILTFDLSLLLRRGAINLEHQGYKANRMEIQRTWSKNCH